MSLSPESGPCKNGGMQTPWGQIEVLDAHVHFLSWGFYSALAQQKGEGTQVETMLKELSIPVPPRDPAEFGRQPEAAVVPPPKSVRPYGFAL